MKDRVSPLQIRFFSLFENSYELPLLLLGVHLCFFLFGCRGNGDSIPPEIAPPVIAASGTVEQMPPVQDVAPIEPLVEKSPPSEESLGAQSPAGEAENTSALSFESRYAYPRARRVPFLEGDSEEGLYRFVLVAQDGIQQVLRFYRKRFSLAPYPYGKGEGIQYLFSQGAAENTVRVRIATLGSELDGLGARPEDRTVITLTCKAVKPPAQKAESQGIVGAQPGSVAPPSSAGNNLGARSEEGTEGIEKGAAVP